MAGQGRPGEQAPELAWIPDPSHGGRSGVSRRVSKQVADGRSERLYMYQWGIRYISGAEEVTASWAEFLDVDASSHHIYYNGSDQGTTAHCRISLANGRRLDVTAHWDEEYPLDPTTSGAPADVKVVSMRRIGPEVKRRAAIQQAMEAIHRVQVGESVSFGPLVISPAGIAADGDRVPWTDVRGIGTRWGKLTITTPGAEVRWKHVRISKVPRFFVFDLLVRTLIAHPRHLPTAGQP